MSVSITKNSPATFVMPVYLDGGERALRWLEEAVQSVLDQTDPRWYLVMVNDQSPFSGTAELLERLSSQDRRIKVVTLPANRGAAVVRNTGVAWAAKNDSPIVLYLDADDIAHPRRLETVRRIMIDDPDASVVYSTFQVIDEHDAEVPFDKLSEPIQEILECNRLNPPQGDTAWIDIGTVTGYANLTSSTAVRTELAGQYPFPDVRAAEDTNAWILYGAAGKFVYTPDVPTRYRIPQDAAASSMRERLGGEHEYFSQQCESVRESFAKAINIAIVRGTVGPAEKGRLLAGYHVRTAHTMYAAGYTDLAKQELERAEQASPDHTKKWIQFHAYDWAARFATP